MPYVLTVGLASVNTDLSVSYKRGPHDGDGAEARASAGAAVSAEITRISSSVAQHFHCLCVPE